MEFKAGQKVRIRGDADDFTDWLDGEIGTIILVNEDDIVVKFDNKINLLEWYVWKYNVIEIVEDV